MRRKTPTIPLVAFLVAGLLVSGCRDYAFDPDGSASPTRNGLVIAPVGIPFEVAYGQSVALEGTELAIEFSYVAEDNRCASNVDCVQAGRAGVVLTLTDSQNVRYQLVAHIPGLVATPYQVNDLIQFDGLRFQLLEVSPYPLNGVEREVKDYAVLLLVDSL